MIHADVNAIYEQVCCHAHHQLAFDPISMLRNLLRKAARLYYERKDASKVGNAMSIQEYKTLYEAVESYAGDNKIDLANYSDTRASTLLRLRTNLVTFVAFKNYQRSADMIKALVDDKGNIRNYAAYEREVIKLGETYHKSWLKAEYNTVVASAQSAAQWSDYQTTKERYPFLVYKTQDDNKVRMAHRSLHNVAKHIDDTFWDSYYPPNGWQCRCYVLQSRTDDGYTTDPSSLPDDKAHPPAFRTNPGKNGKIWNDKHPYFDVTPKVKDKIWKNRVELMNDQTFYDHIDGIDVHYSNYYNDSFEKELAMAKIIKSLLAKPVKILSQMEVDKVTTPDYLIGDIVAEYKDFSKLTNGNPTSIDTIEKELLGKKGAVRQLLDSRYFENRKLIIIKLINGADANRILQKYRASRRAKEYQIDLWIYQDDVLTKHKAR
jgi:SPP1 gp7 family putative phage head morphogenesis protein